MDTGAAWKIYMSTPEAKEQAAHMAYRTAHDRMFDEAVSAAETQVDNNTLERWHVIVDLMMRGQRLTHGGNVIAA